MSHYVIETPHDPEEHPRAVAEVLGMAPESQLVFLWGCRVGVHKAWAVVEAEGTGQALEAVPAFLRARASAHRVETFGADEAPGLWEVEVVDQG